MITEKNITKKLKLLALPVKKSHLKEKIDEIKPFIKKVPRIPSFLNLSKSYPTFKIITDINSEVLIIVKEKFNENVVEIELELNCNYFGYDEILSKLLPEDVITPSSFETVGSIIHLNLDEKQMAYKELIGRVIHKKTNKTVITKIGQISNEYRCFNLEILAGPKTLETIHKENDIRFFIDYEKVYWCSKLQAERSMLLNIFKKDEVICDVFCGVGPLSLAALKKNCKVYANDLNPDAIRCLKKTVAINKLDKNSIFIYNQPADKFLSEIKGIKIDHFFLNLPEYSLDYLKQVSEWTGNYIVHCYFFSKSMENTVEYIESRIGLKINQSMLREVRKVSPSKNMYKLEIFSSDLRKGFSDLH